MARIIDLPPSHSSKTQRITILIFRDNSVASLASGANKSSFQTSHRYFFLFLTIIFWRGCNRLLGHHDTQTSRNGKAKQIELFCRAMEEAMKYSRQTFTSRHTQEKKEQTRSIALERGLDSYSQEKRLHFPH